MMTTARKTTRPATRATAKPRGKGTRARKPDLADQPIPDEFDPGDDGLDHFEEAKSATRSVISPDKKKAFVPSELSTKLTAAVSDDKGRTDPEKLRAFAEANGLWRPDYAKLNVGMQRMNVGTRLHAKVKRGEAIVWLE